MDPAVRALTDGLVVPIDGLVESIQGLRPGRLNFVPPFAEANSLWVLATHTVGSAEQAVVFFLGGEHVERDREAEFRAVAASIEDPGRLRERWQEVRRHIEEVAARLTREDLDREQEHPRFGAVTGWSVFTYAVSHAAGHAEEASFTRRLAHS